MVLMQVWDYPVHETTKCQATTEALEYEKCGRATRADPLQLLSSTQVVTLQLALRLDLPFCTRKIFLPSGVEWNRFTTDYRKIQRALGDSDIDPLVIAGQEGSWFVAAYCHESLEVLEFSLPGIQAGEHFTRPKGFDSTAYFEDRFHVLRGEDARRLSWN
jgi:hypothetical protein